MMKHYKNGQSSFWSDVPHHSFLICSKFKKKKNVFSLTSVPQKRSVRFIKHQPKEKNKKSMVSYSKPEKRKIQHQFPKPNFNSCVPASQHQSKKICFNSSMPASKKQSVAHLKLGKSIDVYVKGTVLFSISINIPVSFAQLKKSVAKVVQVPKDLLHLTMEGRCLTSRSMEFLEPGSTIHYTIKGKGGMQSEAQNERDPGILLIKKDASEDDVKKWLMQRCGLTESELTEFEFVEGKTLFSYDIHTLKRQTKINISQARKIIYLRDHQEGNSVMFKWRSEDVVAHIRQWLKRDLDLKQFQEKMVDGVVLMSYENALEMEQELELRGVLAQRIIVERNTFLQREENPFQCDDSVEAHAKDTMDKDGNDTRGDHLPRKVTSEADKLLEDKNFSFTTREETGTLNIAREVTDFCETGSLAEVKVTSEKMCVSCTDHKIVEIEESSKHASLKLFLQDDLNLLPVRQETYSPSLDFSKCEINVIYHKMKSLNDLEKCFLFVVLCKPDYLRGAAAKTLVVDLWDTIKKYTLSWVNEIPLDHQKDFSVSESRILLCGQELSFDQSPGKVCNLTEFEKQTKNKLSSFPAKILIVDKQILRDNCDGYMLELGTRKDFIPFSFVFKNDIKYWFFDSCKTGHFEQDLLPLMKVGKLESCLFRVKNTVDIVQERVTTSRLDSDFCSDETECTIPTSDLISSVQCDEPKTSTQDEISVKLNDASAVLVKGQDIEKQVVDRRPFGHTEGWKYSEGCLNVIENQSVELKLHKNCPPESDEAKAAFLYKALEYICGCLNERQNGTIYFGVREPVNDGEYGEIAGVEMDQRLSSVYFDLLHNYIEKCFPDEHEVVKMCIKGPFFVPIRNSNPKRCVIEIDVMPSSKLCKSICFIFQPKAIFDKYVHPGRKHIYTKNQNKWSGVFRRYGSSTTYVQSTEKKTFVNNILPDLIVRRTEDEKLQEEVERQLMCSEKAEKLKAFIGYCNSSMYPVLVLPKLSAQQKQKDREYFGFVQYIRWSAIFDFDDDSEKDGVFDMVKDSKNKFEVLETIASDFSDMSVEKRKDKLLFPKKTSWLFANGKSTGDNAFERLDLNAWKNNYWTFIQNGVAFYKDNSVIQPSRRRVLILVSNEVKDGILETSQNIITAFGWDNILFVFDSVCARDNFESKLSDENLLQRSIIMPWKHVHFIVCECLNDKRQSMVKYVCTASGAQVPIMNSKLELWGDLDVLNAHECEDEYKRMTKDERTALSHEEEKKFHQGKPVSWWNFYLTDRSYDHVMKRSIMCKVSARIKSKTSSPTSDVDRLPLVSVYHMPGAGGTTMGRNILWDLRKEFKCAVIKTITEETLRQVIQLWEAEEEGVDRKMLKPLMLLSDSITNDLSPLDEIGLCRKLYRKQKEYMLAKPLAVLIHCIQVIESKAEFCLNQKLTDEEKEWLERKHEKLERKHLLSEFKTFIAFLSMRHEFNPEFLQNTIIHFLNDETLNENEKELISYVALITCYFPLSEGAPGLPVTCFDALMTTIEKYSLPWETILSESAQVLLVTENRNDKEHKLFVRIANQPYAKVILDVVLKQSKKTLGELVVCCLNSVLLYKESFSHKMISRIITKMLIERQAEEGTTELSELSPLIHEIKTSSFEQAVHVLSEGYKRLANAEAIYQQLARLYLLNDDFSKAKEYAQLAVTLAPERKAFKHTLGHVCSKTFASSVKNACSGADNIVRNIEILCVAAEALKSYNETLLPKDDRDALSICYSHCAIIETVNKVFYFLLRLLPKKDLGHLGCYLVDSEYKYALFDKFPEVRLMLKNLLNNGTDALCFLLYVMYSHKFRTSGYSFHQIREEGTLSCATKTCSLEFDKFVKNLKEVPWLSLKDDIRRDSALRLDLVMLKGCFFESIFHYPHLRKTADKGIGILEKMKGLLDEIFEMKCMTVTDKDNFITVCLALELAGKKGAFTDNESQIYEMCCEIIKEKSKDGFDDVCFLRAHLYRMLVTWPNVKRVCFNSEHFKISFCRKYACLTNKRKEPLDPKEHFYVASSKKSFHICHWTDVDLVNLKSSRCKFLENFTGTYKVKKKLGGMEQSFIEFNWDCMYDKLPLKIRKIRGLDVFVDAEVEFHLAFSLQGPLAFIHKVVDHRY